MFQLPISFTAYNKEHKRNFLIKFTNVQGDFIDETGVVHKLKFLTEEAAEKPRLKI